MNTAHLALINEFFAARMHKKNDRPIPMACTFMSNMSLLFPCILMDNVTLIIVFNFVIYKIITYI